MPAAATAHTPEGAVAFAKFFIQTIDWGFATTSGAYMKHYFEHSCTECLSHQKGLDNTRKVDDHYVGGRFSNVRLSAWVPGGNDRADGSLTATFDISSVEVVDSNNNFKNADPAESNIQEHMYLRWTPDGWTVVDMAPIA